MSIEAYDPYAEGFRSVLAEVFKLLSDAGLILPTHVERSGHGQLLAYTGSALGQALQSRAFDPVHTQNVIGQQRQASQHEGESNCGLESLHDLPTFACAFFSGERNGDVF